MHGLILRTFQVFVLDTYGTQTWERIVNQAGLEALDFEAMLNYPPETYCAVVEASETVLKKPSDAFLDDVGTYLVSHPTTEGLRRLLRFGGVDFIEFLHSLEDLPDRARLAVADLQLPDLELVDFTHNAFHLKVGEGLPGFGYVLVGVLRAMADDYGALVLMDCDDGSGGRQIIDITLIETAYAEGRQFELAATGAVGAEE